MIMKPGPLKIAAEQDDHNIVKQELITYKIKKDMLVKHVVTRSFYSNKEDYIDEISKQKNPTPQDGEVIIKLD